MAAIALMGSGEFLPWANAVDSWCIENATTDSDRALIVPAASAPEGEDVFMRWAAMGIEHYNGLGLKPHLIEIRTREDATDAAIAREARDARIVFFSGGNPGYLAETLVGTPFWEEVVNAVSNGTALGGCSAGAVFLGVRAPFVADYGLDHWVRGMGLLERAYVMPHFDMLDSYSPGLRGLFLSEAPAGTAAVGIDENTAICGDGERWRVMGSGSVWTGDAGAAIENLTEYGDEETIELPLGLRLE